MTTAIPLLTFEVVEAEVRRLAAERPDYIYPRDADPGPNSPASCVYTQHKDKPPCLWGQALLNLGVPAATMHDHGDGIEFLLDQLDIETTREQAFWASVAQHAQDSKTPWAEAVALADRRLAERFAQQ